MKLFVKNAALSSSLKSLTFSYGDQKYSGLLEVWELHGVLNPDDLNGAVIEIDDSTSIPRFNGFNYIASRNIVELFKRGTFNIEDHEIVDKEDSEIFIEETDEDLAEEISYEEIDFNSIYDDIPFYEIKKEITVMDPVEKMIQNAVKITKAKYDNGKPNRFAFSYELLLQLGGSPFIDFIQNKISEVVIKAPKEVKIAISLINKHDEVLEHLRNLNLLEYTTKSLVKEYEKKLISTEKLVNDINKRRMSKFNKFKEIAKQALLIKHETGLNPVSLGWPYLVGKTERGTFFHAPLAYQLINIEESLNEFKLTKEPKFKVNTYPILKNYSEQRNTINEIKPEVDSIRELLIEFYKHGIKVKKPYSTKFSNFSQYKIDDPRKDKFPNLSFELTNEVLLTLKPQDEFIFFDLKNIIKDSEEFSMPESTFTIITDTIDCPKKNYINNVDNHKSLAIEKSSKGSLVIYGPPGTGKSETITTLMGDLISKNKKTLFVAEKATAIEVIQTNMKKINLDSFVMNLNNPSKLDFIQKFKKQLNLLLKEYSGETTDGINYAESWNNLSKKLHEISEEISESLDKNEITLGSVVGIANFIEEFSSENNVSYDRIIFDGELQTSVLLDIYNEKKEYIKFKTNFDNLNTQKSNIYIENSTWYQNFKTQILNDVEQLKIKQDELKKEKILIEEKYNEDVNLETIQFEDKKISLKLKVNKYVEENSLELEKHKENIKRNKDAWLKQREELFNEINLHPLNDFFVQEEDVAKFMGLNNTTTLSLMFLKKKPVFINKFVKKNNVALKEMLLRISKFEKIKKSLEHDNEYLEDILNSKEAKIKEFKETQNEILETFEAKFIHHKILIKKNFDENMEKLENEININSILIPNLDSLPNSIAEFFMLVGTETFGAMVEYYKDFENLTELVEIISEINDKVMIEEEALRQYNIEEIDYVYSKFEEHYINPETFEKDLDMFFMLQDNPDVLENLDCKWSDFKNGINNHIEEVRSAMISNYSNSFILKYQEDPIFKNEIDKITKFVNNKLTNSSNSVNALFAKKYEFLKEMFPVIMMNPELVSQTFKPTKDIFDYAIFDEASQIRLHKAVPSLHRAKLAIVAGDSKQLGPTDLFSIESDGEYDIDMGENEELNNKTLLNYAKDMYAQVQLNTHYRSKSKDLIEFSNKTFYDNKMEIADSPLARLEGSPGILVEEIDGYWTEDRTNEEEAQRVLELFKHYRINLNKTVGVITFNDKQRDLIRFKLESEPELQDKLGLEDYFLKSIKYVQGDERDVIIFSITYGKRKASGTYVSFFGRFSKEKINVAITRSKLRMHVLKSIPSSAVKESNDDYIVFKRWLEFIEGKRDQPKNFDDYDFDNFNSEFERDYYKSIVKYMPETIIALPNYKVASKEIDLVLYDKETNRFIGAIELDGHKWHGSAEQKAADFERQTYLETMGWQFVRTTFWEFYKNRNARVKRDFETLVEISAN